MDILTQEQLLLNAQAKFDALKKKIWEDSQAGIRIDQEERDAFAELQAIGLMLLQGFAAGAGVEVLAKSEAEFPVDVDEVIDDRRRNLAVQQRRIALHSRILEDCGERWGILSMQCCSFRCPAVWVLRPSPFLNNVSGRPGAPKPMGVSAGSPRLRAAGRGVSANPGGAEKLRISQEPVRPAPGSTSPAVSPLKTKCSTPISLADCYQNHPHEVT
jgi:hypothetical protein